MVTTIDMSTLVFAFALVVVAAVFAGFEAALARVSRVRVDEMARDDLRGARRLQRVLADAPRYLNLALFLRVVFETAAVVVVAAVWLDLVDSAWRALVAAATTMVVVSYVVIGVSPRTLGRQHADVVARAGAAVLDPLARVLGPLPTLLILLGNALTPGKGFREGPFATEAELRELVDLAEKNRVIADEERQMIHSVFELGDTLVREVMVPRTDMVFIERHKTLRQAMSLGLRSGFSRIPVVGTGEDDVVGVVYLKDLVRRVYEHRNGESTERVESIMRSPTFVPESKKIDELLREMQRQQIHIAIVVDEYGGTAGLVTMEDLVEEIVGEITDEYDHERPPVEHLPGGGVRVTARLPVEELGELFGVDLDNDDIETVGGLMAACLGLVPIPGATVEVKGIRLTAESLEGRRNRVGTVLAERVGEPPDGGPGDRASRDC